MLIDWFTIVAQIVNFLVLAYLLKRFLYAPIVAVMHQREQTIVARLQEADQQRAVADREAQELHEQQLALEQERPALRAEVRHDVEVERETLMRAAREDVAALKATWLAALQRDQATFLAALRRRAAVQVVDVARRVLNDLADASLERQIVRVFLDRLRTLAAGDRAALERALARAPSSGVIRSAFPLAADECEQISDGLRDLLGQNLELRSETAPDLMSGISLVIGGHEIGWSIESYLETLEQEVAQALTATAPEPETMPAVEIVEQVAGDGLGGSMSRWASR